MTKLNKSGATLVGIVAATLATILLGVAIRKSSLLIERANAAIGFRGAAEKQMSELLDRIAALIQKRASFDLTLMPYPLMGTALNGSPSGVIPADSATCPNPIVPGTPESASCQDLRVFQGQAAGGYREVRMTTACRDDSALRGMEGLRNVITPFTSGGQVCQTGLTPKLPRFQMSTISDVTMPDLGYPTVDPAKTVTQYYPSVDVATAAVSNIRGMAVCFRVCHPIAVTPTVFRAPESVMIQIGSIYRTGGQDSEGRPKYDVIEKQRILNFTGQSSTIEFLSAK